MIACCLLKVLCRALRREDSIQDSKFIQKKMRSTVQGQVIEPEQCSSVSLIQVSAGCCQYGGWIFAHWHGPVPVMAYMS